jgi:hypothetical protein
MTNCSDCTDPITPKELCNGNCEKILDYVTSSMCGTIARQKDRIDELKNEVAALREAMEHTNYGGSD